MQNNTTISIKKASLDDLHVVLNIVRKSSDWLKETYNFTHWDSYYSLEKIKENFEKKSVYLLYSNNIPVATYAVGETYPSYYSEKDITNFSNPKSSAYYPTTLSVLPEYHGQGFAKLLIKHLEELAKENDIKYIRFDARGIYTELISFYKKMNFKVVGELIDEGDIYYLFEKEIS